MMKKYKVCGFSPLVDAEMHTNDTEQASDLFETMMNSEVYIRGYIVDNETGEVYCHFSREVEGNGIKTTYWTALA